MKAIILNSGKGSRLKEYTSDIPKSMVEISKDTCIFSKAMNILLNFDIDEFIVTTGYLDAVLRDYAVNNFPNVNFTFVHNPFYDSSNYIKSLDYVSDDIADDVLLLHGDLIFDEEVIEMLISSKTSAMVVDSGSDIPLKDFKDKVVAGYVKKVSVDYFGEDAIASQALYKLNNHDWIKWKERIRMFCKKNNVDVYAENALNELFDEDNIIIKALDIAGYYCREIDTVEELLEYRNTFGDYND